MLQANSNIKKRGTTRFPFSFSCFPFMFSIMLFQIFYSPHPTPEDTMLREMVVKELKEIGRRFTKTVSVFEEADAGFSPKEEMHSVAYTIAHAGESIVWLIEGGFNPGGFDMDFEAQHRKVAEKSSTLAEALAHFDECVERAVAVIEKRGDFDFMGTLPAGPVLGGQPKIMLIEAVSDHTASHRGTLGVYARLLGKVPPMPYED